MICTPHDSWHHHPFKCIDIVQLSACSCAVLIEIYDHVQVPLTFQDELWKDRSTLRGESGISEFQSNYIFFENIAYSPFSHINERTNTCLCEIHLGPSFHLPACCDPSLALYDLTRTDHSCQFSRELLPVTVLRASQGTEEQLAVCRLLEVCVWGGGHCSCSSLLWPTAPLHMSLSWGGRDAMEVSAADETYRIQ